MSVSPPAGQQRESDHRRLAECSRSWRARSRLPAWIRRLGLGSPWRGARCAHAADALSASTQHCARGGGVHLAAYVASPRVFQRNQLILRRHLSLHRTSSNAASDSDRACTSRGSVWGKRGRFNRDHLRSRRPHRSAVRRCTRRDEPLRRSARPVRAVLLHVRPAAEVAPALGAPERGILAERVEVKAVVAVALRGPHGTSASAQTRHVPPCTVEDRVA